VKQLHAIFKGTITGGDYEVAHAQLNIAKDATINQLHSKQCT